MINGTVIERRGQKITGYVYLGSFDIGLPGQRPNSYPDLLAAQAGLAGRYADGDRGQVAVSYGPALRAEYIVAYLETRAWNRRMRTLKDLRRHE